MVDLAELTKKIVSGLVPNTLTCTYDIPLDLWPAKADEKQIEQVIYNLVDNACTAMNGQGQIEISLPTRITETKKTSPYPPINLSRLPSKTKAVVFPRIISLKYSIPISALKTKTVVRVAG